MNVLMLSTDPRASDPDSPTGRRLAGYRSFADVRILVVTPNVFKVLREGKRLMTDWKPDIISSQDPFVTGLIALILARRAHARLQIQIHTDFAHLAYVWESPKHLIELLIARFVLPAADCIRAVSARAADGARGLTHAPVSVLPIRVTPPPPEALALPREFSRKPTFITVSRLTTEKRLDMAIRAIADVPEAELFIIGEGPLEARLIRLTKRMKLERQVHFLGWRSDPAPFYRHAAAFVQMSRYEGYGMAMMEAVLAGCPVITTDVGTVGDILPRAALFVIPGTTSALVRAMKEVVADPSTAKEKATRAKEIAERALMTEEEYHHAYAEALTTCLS